MAILVSIWTVTILLCFLVASSGAEEASDSRCDVDHSCNQGRCCSRYFFCGTDYGHCVTYCLSQCHYVPPPQTTAAVVAWRRPAEGTLDHLLNINATFKNVNSSSPCAISLSNVPLAVRNKYALAAFGAKISLPQLESSSPSGAQQPTNTTTNYCGKCMKLRNRGSGAEAMVRIVDERSSEGLELDRETFDKLRAKRIANAESNDDRHLVLEYRFYNC
ncbi:unnamed protein product [Linum tenue]|uniref:Barwin domain-containing protein n=1 Tax=Linum tenue TaxID=586396 RepID=A0AAV0P0A7_9ROSI|nr:unnamed protein product [Linum tenue]